MGALVNTRPIADLHAHTMASGHAFNTLDEMAQAAAAAGLAVLGITDHGPTMTGAPTHGYFEMAHRIPKTLHGVRILLGCEANILDHQGSIDIDDQWAPAQGVLLAGLHGRTPYDSESTITQNTAAVIGAIENPAVHIISHPYRPHFPVEPETVARAAAACGTALEVNLSLFKPLLSDVEHLQTHPSIRATREMLAEVLHHGGSFVLNSDAHHASEIAANHAAAQHVCAALRIPLAQAANYGSRLGLDLPNLKDNEPLEPVV
ncbi:PHP domain-containing protein [Streptomyces sp. NPDC050085]|uniref:PHP domain-containing protein n=1 Tax=Streptomyces sp. NPDC050085 TaxID=3365600 RepID=UPI0037B68F03